MTDITEFIRARLDEMAAPREREARHETFCLDPTDRTSDGRCLYCGATPDPAKVELVEQSPRVLAQVAAMRAIVGEHLPREGGVACRTCVEFIIEDHPPSSPQDWPCDTLRHLAATWSSHDDYDPAWAPGGE